MDDIDIRTIKSLWFGGIKEGRKEKLLSNLSKLGISAAHIEPIVLKNGVKGCRLSAKKALTSSLDFNEPVLILEDDCSPTM